jgi:acyl dehydratase
MQTDSPRVVMKNPVQGKEMSNKNILEQFTEEMKTRIGQIHTYSEFDYLDPDYRQEHFNTQVTRDAVKHFVDGIGDINPLYRDRSYALKSKYGRLVAPPTFLETITYAQHPEGVPLGVQGFLSGFEWEYFQPVYEGDEYKARVIYPLDVKLKSSQFAKQLAIIYEKGDLIKNEDVVASYISWVIFVEGNRSDDQKTEKALEKMPGYSKEEIENIYRTQDKELPRGSEPRYWEDVIIGQELPPVVRGPYTLSEKLAWFVGKGNPPSCVSDRLFRIIAEKHHENKGVYDSGLNIYIRPSMFDKQSQSDRGVPRIHDAGAQRNAWRNMVFTNWMGDDGFLWKSRAEIRGFNQEGDITWCKAKVNKKYIVDGRYCVDIECWCENQRHEVTMPGTGTVMLPSRERGPVIYPEHQSSI